MSGGDGDDDRGVADLQPADAVADGDERTGVTDGLLGDAVQELLRIRVGRILEGHDHGARVGVVVAHTTHERCERAGCGVVHGGEVRVEIEGLDAHACDDDGHQ